jgi:hypothetical protein
MIGHHLARFFEPVMAFAIAFGAVQRIFPGFERLEKGVGGCDAGGKVVGRLRLVGQSEIGIAPAAAAHVDGFRQRVGIADGRLRALVALNQGEAMVNSGVVSRDAFDYGERGNDRRHRTSAIHDFGTHQVGAIGDAIQVNGQAEGLLDEVRGGEIEDTDLAYFLVIFAAQRQRQLQSFGGLVRLWIQLREANEERQ